MKVLAEIKLVYVGGATQLVRPVEPMKKDFARQIALDMMVDRQANGVEAIDVDTGRVIVSNGDLSVPFGIHTNKLKDPDGIKGKNGGMSIKDRAKHDYEKTCTTFPDKVKEMKRAIVDRIVQGKTPKFNVVLKMV